MSELKDTYLIFADMEEELELFQRRAAGARWWEHVRFDVFSSLLQGRGIHLPLAAPYQPTVMTRLARAARSFLAVRENPFLSRHHDVLFYGHSRRKAMPDGTWWDIYCDPVIDAFAMDSIYLERPYRYGHARPAHTRRLTTTDFLRVMGNPLRWLHAPRLEAAERDGIEAAGAALRSRFDVEVDLTGMVERLLAFRAGMLPQYRSVLRRIRPKAVFLAPGYGSEIFIEACREAGVVAVELQHGTATRYHLGYSFERPGAVKETFPDRFFAFGPYWTETVRLPIPAERVHHVGYPFLLERRAELEGLEKRAQVVVLSQAAIGDRLSRFAVALAERLPAGWRCLYKLHPAEFPYWREAYPWLAEQAERVEGFEVLEGDRPELYELLATSAMQVGVYSTAVFEGLAFGCRTWIVDLPGSEYMDDLVAEGAAERISSADAIRFDVTDADDIPFRRERFFGSDWRTAFRKAVADAGLEIGV